MNYDEEWRAHERVVEMICVVDEAREMSCGAAVVPGSIAHVLDVPPHEPRALFGAWPIETKRQGEALAMHPDGSLWVIPWRVPVQLPAHLLPIADHVAETVEWAQKVSQPPLAKAKPWASPMFAGGFEWAWLAMTRMGMDAEKRTPGGNSV